MNYSYGFVFPNTVPQPKNIKITTSGTTQVGNNFDIQIPSEFYTLFQAPVIEFKNAITLLNNNGNIKQVNVYIKSKNIQLSVQEEIILKHEESYIIRGYKDRIEIISNTALGALHGFTTFEELIKVNKGNIPDAFTISDWPDIKTRALHFTISGSTTDDARILIQKARQGHYNMVILQIYSSVKLDSMSRILRPNPWSVQEFKDIVKYANENGLEVVPHITLLSHQRLFFKNYYPDLLLNKDTYDPSNEEVYKVIFPMLDEIINVMHPKAIHIGHDEIYGVAEFPEKPLKNEKILSSELFLYDTIKIHDYLSARGVETWMWGDMLMAKKEFPGEFHQNGNKEYAAIRDRIPKDIVICDWHYFEQGKNFPSIQAFVDSGHDVFGAIWGSPKSKYNGKVTVRNFSKYVALMSSGNRGMIATTWYVIPREREIIYTIIKESGEAFWNAASN